MKHFFLLLLIMLAGSSAGAQSRYHVKKMATESLDRGVVAIRQADGKVVVSWRVLRDDHHHEAFDVYRNGHRLTPQPLTKGGTFFIDEQPLQGEDAIYEVKGGSVNGQYTLCADAPVGYLPVKLEKPEGGKVPVMEGQHAPTDRVAVVAADSGLTPANTLTRPTMPLWAMWTATDSMRSS